MIGSEKIIENFQYKKFTYPKNFSTLEFPNQKISLALDSLSTFTPPLLLLPLYFYSPSTFTLSLSKNSPSDNLPQLQSLAVVVVWVDVISWVAVETVGPWGSS